MGPTPKLQFTNQIEDITPVLNISKQRDLTRILEMTPDQDRISVACAFSRIKSRSALVRLTGYPRSSLRDWLDGRRPVAMPLLAMRRIAAHFGVSPKLLFERHYSRFD